MKKPAGYFLVILGIGFILFVLGSIMYRLPKHKLDMTDPHDLGYIAGSAIGMVFFSFLGYKAIRRGSKMIIEVKQ